MLPVMNTLQMAILQKRQMRWEMKPFISMMQWDSWYRQAVQEPILGAAVLFVDDGVAVSAASAAVAFWEAVFTGKKDSRCSMN